MVGLFTGEHIEIFCPYLFYIEQKAFLFSQKLYGREVGHLWTQFLVRWIYGSTYTWLTIVQIFD